MGEKQTALLKLDPKWGIKASVAEVPGGYAVVVAVPRSLVFGDAAAGPGGAATQPATTSPSGIVVAGAVMNITVIQ